MVTPDRLREWRAVRRWSVAKAARECAVSRASWAAWEAGERTAPPWLGYVLRAVGDGQAAYH